MESAREARRRKILERGSDRIRMITAGSVNAPAAQPDQEIQRGKGEGDEIQDSVSSIAAPKEEIEITNTPLIDSSKDLETKRETLIDPFRKQEETFKSNDEITLEKPEEPKIESQIKRGETQIPPNYPNNNNQKWIFTPNQISRAISNSEIIRLIFVIFFSFLVIKGFITSKPLLILILTDITIIIGLLIANKDDNNKNKKKNKREKENYNMPIDKISIIIEIGILVQKGLSAIFIDSCIYAVIMICALGI